ncbi:MAG: GlsB/YeaQ/YmgE family stress response membrane protein [Anaerolineaceae bacterium]
MVMGLLSWIVVGLIAGWLAGLIMRGSGFGLIGNIIVGVIGGLLGGWLASSVFHIGPGMSGINFGSIMIAFLGAIVLILILRLLGLGKRRV